VFFEYWQMDMNTRNSRTIAEFFHKGNEYLIIHLAILNFCDIKKCMRKVWISSLKLM
jgi:hypothetical protein